MNYFFVGGPYHAQTKVMDLAEFPLSLPGGTYRTSGDVRSSKGTPDFQNVVWWPNRDVSPSVDTPIAVGEAFPLDENNAGNCSSTRTDGSGIFIAYCVLDEGHAGLHIATDGVTVVQTWA